MILEVRELLTAEELAQLRQIGERANFLDGRLSNAGYDQKQNLQIDHALDDYRTSSTIVMNAFNRSREFKDFAVPRRIATPMMTKYTSGMKYGAHADSALLPLPDGPMRSDISCTVFLSDPGAYQGGELVVHLGDRSVPLKAQAGAAILYPSTTLHEVVPVRAGTRLVAITFIESFIADQANRYAVFELGEVSALEGLNMNPINRLRLEAVRQNLIRQWST